MSKSAKVAISLPEHVLRDIERERKTRGESRSEFFRRAVEELLKRERQSGAVEAYVRGYCAMPESTEEVREAHQTGVALLADAPW